MFGRTRFTGNAAQSVSRDGVLRRATLAVVERMEGRMLLAADPLGFVNTVQTLPYVLEFNQPVDGLHDKDGEDIGFTAVQVNKNGLSASYVPSLIDLDTTAGVLNITTSGTSTAGSNYNGDNTLTNSLETTFDSTTAGFQITVRIKGPLNYINLPNEQAGIYFGPDQDNYVKLVAIAREEGPRLQFVDEQTYNGVYTHSLNSIRDIGKFVNSETLDLRLEGDAASGRVLAYYSINGASFVKMPAELQLYAEKRAAFFSTTTRAGIITLHKNDTGPMTVSYDRFEILPGRELAGRPTVTRTRPAAGATDVPRDTFVAADLNLPNAGIDTDSLNGNTVKLYRTSDRSLVQSVVNTSGGGDTIVLQPRVLLEANTTYTFEVTDGVKDTAGAAFIPYVANFTTGTAGGAIDPSLAFEKLQLPGTPGEQYTSIAMGPGNTSLWAGTADGKILKFPLNSDGTVGTANVYTSLQDANVGQRLVTGFVFDPASTESNPILYVNHGFADIVNAPNWSTKTTKLSGSNLQTVEDLIVGLPRAVKDHLTNQPSFGPDGALYFNQGSMSAMGAPDVQWGQRSEELLSASILRLDLTKLTPGVPLDVRTDAGAYDPFAPNAPLTIYATGVRNAWDMVWTDDGRLYTATNGSAAGGNTPSTPSLPILGSRRIDGDDDNNPDNGHYSNPRVEGTLGVDQTMNDFLYLIEPGGYYGQPNPKRFEFVLNGGNPTSEVDQAEVPSYPIGTLPDRNWRGNVFDFGPNLSPNGMIQYKNATAFNGALAGKLMVVRYSGGDDIIVMTLGDDGSVQQTQTGITGMGNFADPLDLVENTTNGYIYVAEFSESDPTQRRISLLRPIPPGPRITTDKSLLVFSDVAEGSTGGSGSSVTLTVRITNAGNEPLLFPSDAFSIIDDPNSGGDDSDLFSIVNQSELPDNLGVGEFANVRLKFTAPAVGIESAFLRIKSNDPSKPTINIGLRGVGIGGLNGANEPSLARILRAYNIPTIVGDGPNDADEGSVEYPVPPHSSSQEVLAPRMVKAGAGNVTIELLALQGNQRNGVSSRMGYYKPGNRADKTELFSTGEDSRTLSPVITSGSTAFDPGTAPFGLYGVFPPFQDATKDKGLPREIFSEDSLNTWESNSANRRKIRFFPLKNPDGSVVPDAYVFGVEEFDAANDSNDVVGIIRNVRPIAAGPEIGLENADGVPFSNRLVFSRIQNPDNSAIGKPNNKVHDTATIILRNTGTDPLVIGSVTVGGQFSILNPPVPNHSIAAGETLPINVSFIATTGDVRDGLLTIASNDEDEPVTQVQLSGFWQSESENNQEPTLFETVQVLGYRTQITGPGQLLSIPGEEGKIRRVGDEVLSPYWRRADSSTPVTVRQLSAYHSQGSAADIYYHAKGSNTTTHIFEHSGDYGQSLLPLITGETGPAYGKFNPSGTFGFRVDSKEWSDPTKNAPPPELPQDEGHHLRFWVVRDQAGQIVRNTFLLAMDYAGINYDYNDNVYLITNIAPDSPPVAPAGLTAVNDGAIKLDWTDSTEANLSGYNVYRSDAESGPWEKINTSLLAESTFSDIFAPVGAASHYQVKAVDNVGNESSPATASATRTVDDVPPDKPVGLTAVELEAGIAIDWANNTEVDLGGYRVYRSASAGGPWTLLTASLLRSSDYNDSTAPIGETSHYQIVAFDEAGNASEPATINGFRPNGDVEPPAAPAGLSAQAVSPSVVNLTWNASDGAASYVLERRVAGAEEWGLLSSTLTATSFSDNGLDAATTYQYRVRARNEGGSSPNSDIATATTLAQPLSIKVSVSNASVTEPATGTASALFTISLDAASAVPITVNYSTADGTAIQGLDYGGTDGSLTFNAGETSKTVAVNILPDALDEATETFFLNIEPAAAIEGVEIANAQGVGSIGNSSSSPLPVGGKTVATYTGLDGRPVRISMRGPGTGEVTVLADGVARIVATGTTPATKLSIKGNTAVEGLTTDGPLRMLTGKGVRIAGDISIAGAVRKITLGDTASAGHTIFVGAGEATAIVLGNVSDLELDVASPVKSLKVSQWLDSDGTRDVVRAPFVGNVKSKGDFAADVIADSIGKVSAKGAITDSDIRSAGDIASVAAASLQGSRVFAGVHSQMTTLPASADDFAGDGTIRSVKVKSKGAGAFSDSYIAANQIGKVKLGSVTTVNGGAAFGVAADGLRALNATTPTGSVKLKNGAEPEQSSNEDDFFLRLL